MPERISATSHVRYIKLGWHGMWEKECLEKGIRRLGYGTEKARRFRLCKAQNWSKLKQSFLDEDHEPPIASRFTKDVRLFFADPGTTLWITFHGDRMYWGFLEPGTPECHPDGIGTWRAIAKGWRSDDMRGIALTKSRLSPKVTKLTGYPGTSCNVQVPAYVVRRINGISRKLSVLTPITHQAADLSPPGRIPTTIYRILRDTAKSRQVKELHQFSQCAK